jgi:enoyl-CoA hydratase/carnithine racemase
MLQLETVECTVEGRVGRVTLNRPEVLNAANVEWVRDLNAALDAVAGDERVRVVLVTGRGRAFCSGIDLTVLGTGAIRRQWFVDWERAMSLCEEMPKPVICGIQGYCIGGGLQLALACDIRVCSTDARLGLTAVKECLIPGLGVWRLPRFVGLGVAKRLIMTGELVTGEEALRMNMVDYLVEPDQLEPKLLQLAEQFSHVSTSSFRHCKRLTNRAFDLDHPTVLAQYFDAQEELLGSPEHLEAMAAWQERREPNF